MIMNFIEEIHVYCTGRKMFQCLSKSSIPVAPLEKLLQILN